MKPFLLALTCAVAVSAPAQLPTTSPMAAGFDPARLEILHATTKRFVEDGKHAGIITLIARHGKIVDFQTYGYRDVGKQLRNDLGQLSMPSSIGQFGWYGAATTYCQIDPKEGIVAIALSQHSPYNQHNFFAQFQTGYYQALK